MTEDKYRELRRTLKVEMSILNRLYYCLKTPDFIKGFETLPHEKQIAFERLMNMGHYGPALNIITQTDENDPYTWSVRKLRIFCRKHKIPYYSVRPKADLVREVLSIMKKANTDEEVTVTTVQQSDSVSVTGNGQPAY